MTTTPPPTEDPDPRVAPQPDNEDLSGPGQIPGEDGDRDLDGDEREDYAEPQGLD
jgi:hypothetical protein